MATKGGCVRMSVPIIGDDGIDIPLIEGRSGDGLASVALPDLAKGPPEGLKFKEKEEDTAMVAIVEGIQPVPKKVVRKIESGEFVDFADLLQDQFPSEELNLPSSHSGVVLVQSLDSLKRKKKRVNDFQGWVEALLVYAAVRCRDTLPELANVMAYGVIMGQTAKDYPVDKWLTYDRKFREMAGAKKETKWNEINSGLWNRCFSGISKTVPPQKTCSSCMSSGHSSWDCPNSNTARRSIQRKRLPQPLAGPDQKHNMCFPFNNRGECDRGGECPFLHKCISCGDDHPQLHCRVKRRGVGGQA